MILEYLRPSSVPEAVRLLERRIPVSVPLGGGTVLSQKQGSGDYAVVDLQDLGLGQIQVEGNQVTIGSMARIQDLVESEVISMELQRAAHREMGRNLRQSATLGGTLVAGDGVSPLLTAMLAADAVILWEPGSQELPIGEWLLLRETKKSGLITAVKVSSNATLAFDCAAKTPEDKPLVSVAVATWPSGRTRIAVGGGEKVPMLVMDGTEGNGAEESVENAYSHFSTKNATSEYLIHVTKVIVRRLLTRELQR